MTNNKKPNHGAKKLLFFGAFMQLFLGIIYGFSIMAQPMADELDWSLELVSLTSPFMMASFCVGCLTSDFYCKKHGSSQTTLLGGLLLSIGIACTFFANNTIPWLLWITYGVIGGFGAGFAYITIVTATQQQFKHKKGLASAIIVGAFGLSTVLLTPLLEFIIPRFGVKVTLLFMGITFLIVTLLCFRNIQTDIKEENINICALPEQDIAIKTLLKQPNFYLLVIAVVFTALPYTIISPYIRHFCIDAGLSVSTAMMAVMLSGIFNTLGRFVFPFLSDKIGRKKVYLILCLGYMFCSMITLFQTGSTMFIALLGITFLFGGATAVNPILVGETYGSGNLTRNLGTIMLFDAGFSVSVPSLMAAGNAVSYSFIYIFFIALFAFIALRMMREVKR